MVLEFLRTARILPQGEDTSQLDSYNKLFEYGFTDESATDLGLLDLLGQFEVLVSRDLVPEVLVRLVRRELGEQAVRELASGFRSVGVGVVRATRPAEHREPFAVLPCGHHLPRLGERDARHSEHGRGMAAIEEQEHAAL